MSTSIVNLREKTPLLLVEDDSNLAGSLADYLSNCDYEVDFAFNGVSCVELARRNEYAVIIMDVSMPMMDGLTACHQLRHDLGIDTPVIFLTARDTLDDKIAGYKSGGDDYLVKPFAPRELVCRIEALRKRQHVNRNIDKTIGGLTIHPKRLQVSFDDQSLELHAVQIQILMLLANAAPEVVSKRTLEVALWPDETPQSNPLRTHVYRLRRQLNEKFGYHFIETVHGRGYRIDLPD